MIFTGIWRLTVQNAGKRLNKFSTCTNLPKARHCAKLRIYKHNLSCDMSHSTTDLNEWQINELKAAIKEADAGDFASNKEVQAVFNKWGVDGKWTTPPQATGY